MLTRHNRRLLDAYRGAGRPEATFVVERIVEIAARYRLLLMVDEIYDQILYDDAVFQPVAPLAGDHGRCAQGEGRALAAGAGITVTDYRDRPTAVMVEERGGGGQFESVTLNPVVTVAPGSDEELAERLHHRVGDYCFIARSVKTPIHHHVTIRTAPAAP